MQKIIGVSGSNEGDENLNSEIFSMAEEVGYLIAKNGGILVCGGLGGVMESAAKGAKRGGGITVGILPGKKETANPYIDIPIATDLGFYRNYIIVYSADSLISICGRWGTLNEISMAVALGKPTILLSTSDGVSEILSRKEFIEKMKRRPFIARTPEEAVKLAFSFSR